MTEKIRAYQYLYYVRNISAITDREYDRLCEAEGVFGGGGSDREQDYTPEEKALAESILRGE